MAPEIGRTSLEETRLGHLEKTGQEKGLPPPPPVLEIPAGAGPLRLSRARACGPPG